MRTAVLALATLAALGALASCSDDDPKPAATPAGDAGADSGSLEAPATACADALDSVYGDPGALAPDPAARGQIVRCAKDADVTKDAMQAKLTELGYTGKPLTSGARVYRVAFRTERGDAASTPAVSSAAVYVPETPRAAKLPVVVASRGSRRQAARCAASKLEPGLGVNDDLYRQVYALAGAGYAVIVPDLAGYANFGAPGNPPSAYAQAADVAKSTLDGARALKNLFPVLDDKVVIVGHSQGGHTALSALALAETYGTVAPIVGVAVYAPLWLSQRSWGAVLYRPVGKDFPLKEVPGTPPTPASAAGPVSVWYHYTQAELLDGPGEGKKLFAADKQDAVKEFVETECWASEYPKLQALGTYADELFDPAFVQQVGFASIGSGSCDPGSACEKWLARYSADRPRLTGKAAQTPILVAYGAKDTTIPPSRMKCALDRLAQDGAQVTVCLEPEQTHGGILDARGSYVADWIGSVALGEAAPGACPADATAITEACATPPPND